MSKCIINGKGKKKTKYETRGEAEKAIAFIWGNDPTVNMDDLHVYTCPKCGKFHIGHDRTKILKGAK